MTNESALLENSEAFTTLSEESRKTSPILKALSRHVSQWPDTKKENNKREKERGDLNGNV